MLRTLTALGFLVTLTASADAARVPSSKADRSNNAGSRPDITSLT